MNKRFLYAVFFFASTVLVAGLTSIEKMKVSFSGLGPVKPGMTVPEASTVLGVSLKSEEDSGTEGCAYFVPANGVKGLYFMVVDDHIVRVDVENPAILTENGAKVGDTENTIKKIYGNNVVVGPHHYEEKGHYLTIWSRDKKFLLLFETDDKGIVTRYRSGLANEVKWSEGCA